jgi:uncharacterized protein YdiU (UPF0061 family)
MNAVTGNLPPLSNRFVTDLPGDPDSVNRTRQVNHSCYSLVTPRKFPEASLLAWSHELGTELGFSPDTLGTERFKSYVSGNELLPGLQPYALCYGGHQFGHWAGQLGDGRAINLGEIVSPAGQHQILQLKGAGPTPYSRTADGLAVMRSSVREFLCSEAMHHLGVPTTRALSLVSTGETVLRDMFYDGNAELEPGAIVCRVAPSFLRFGSYEIFSARNEHATLKQLVDFTLTRDFPQLGQPNRDSYLAWFNEVCQRTASLMVHWMRVGFVHGVMNTDNMSILGLTIDYGPYGWVENYDPNWTPNTTDAEGRRYRFGNQPHIALWNLVQLANAIYPLVNTAEPLEQALTGYKTAYEMQWLQMMRHKLGLQRADAQDPQLIEQLFECFRLVETDMTLFYRALADIDFTPEDTLDLDSVPSILRAAWYSEGSSEAQKHLLQWLQDYSARLLKEKDPHYIRRALMNRTNPLYVPRNWLVQLAIDEIQQSGSTTKLNELMNVLKHPYNQQDGKQHLAAKRPEWARQRAGCSMLSCSS